jgi:hypothetical protein
MGVHQLIKSLNKNQRTPTYRCEYNKKLEQKPSTQHPTGVKKTKINK